MSPHLFSVAYLSCLLLPCPGPSSFCSDSKHSFKNTNKIIKIMYCNLNYAFFYSITAERTIFFVFPFLHTAHQLSWHPKQQMERTLSRNYIITVINLMLAGSDHFRIYLTFRREEGSGQCTVESERNPNNYDDKRAKYFIFFSL